jgi:hypothetical protein
LVAGKQLIIASICPAGHWYNSTTTYYSPSFLFPFLSLLSFLLSPFPTYLSSFVTPSPFLCRLQLSLSLFFSLSFLFIYIRPRSALWMPRTLFSTILLRYPPLSLSLISLLYIYILYIIPSRATVIGIVSLYEFCSPNG